MKNFLAVTLLCILTLLSGYSYAGNGKPYNNIVFFGDSLTDNGNMYIFSLSILPKSPPYFKGRFSNGPTWADVVADNYRAKKISFRNDALGGETVVLRDPFLGYLPYNFEMSINTYEVATVFKDRSKSLFVIWLGANDYLNGAVDPIATTDKTINTLMVDIQRLIDMGGSNFMVLNLPEFAKTPFGLGSKPDVQQNFRSLVMMHNLRLSIGLMGLQMKNPEANIRLFDIYKLFNLLLEQPSDHQHGFKLLKDTTHACWPGGYTLNQTAGRDAQTLSDQLREKLSLKGNALQAREFDTRGYSEMIMTNPALKEAYRVGKAAEAGVEACANPDDYVFWDQVHPTAIAHKMLAERIIGFIDENYKRE